MRVCALLRDFSLLPYGDKTIVGERGISLSGGQRARVNLARAIYKNADIYLLDDPLSAVDTQVGQQIFDECISGYLKDKIVVLATHQLQYMKYVAQIVLMSEGSIVIKGNYHELTSSNVNFARFLEVQQPDTNVEEEDKVQIILSKLSKNNALSTITIDPEGEKVNSSPSMIRFTPFEGATKYYVVNKLISDHIAHN